MLASDIPDWAFVECGLDESTMTHAPTDARTRSLRIASPSERLNGASAVGLYLTCGAEQYLTGAPPFAVGVYQRSARRR